MRLVLFILTIILIDCSDNLIEYVEDLRNELIYKNVNFLNSTKFNDGKNNFSLKTENKLFNLHDNKKYTNNNFLANENNETKFENLYEKYLSTKYLYWEKGYRGKVRIGIFDSGVNRQYLNCNIIEVINYTEEESGEDMEGHGTFITSVLEFNIDYM